MELTRRDWRSALLWVCADMGEDVQKEELEEGRSEDVGKGREEGL